MYAGTHRRSRRRCGRCSTIRSIPTREGCCDRCRDAAPARGSRRSRARCRGSGPFPSGCAFAPRCPSRFEPCAGAPGARRPSTTRCAASSTTAQVAAEPACGLAGVAVRRSMPLMPLVEVRNLTKAFSRRHGLFSRATRVVAVDAVSFAIEEGETFGLVGESGSGKTTTGRCILRLIEPTSRRGAVPRQNVLGLSRDRVARGAPRHADGLPGSLLVAQPAHAGRDDRGGAAGDPRPRHAHRAPRSRRRAARRRRASTRRCAGAIRTSSAADNVSASASRARSRSIPRSSSPTSRCRRWTCRFRRR